MSDFWHGVAQVGGFLAKDLAKSADDFYRRVDRALENGDYKTLARLTPEQFDAYIKYNPEATAALRAAGERWEKWGRG